MRTEVIAVDPAAPDAAVLERAAAVLREGGLVAFPTETVYGLGARADRDDAVRKIYAAKGRPSSNPLIAHVADVTAARALSSSWPMAAERLAEAFWPGPLTLVVPRAAGAVVDRVAGGGPTVAVRVPSGRIARALLAVTGLPVAAPSANPSGGLSPTTAAHVLKGLDGRVDLVLDGGPADLGIESTVVDVTSSPSRLLRPGTRSVDELRAVLPDLVLFDADRAPSSLPLPSPGMLERHYAPRATLRLVDADALPHAVASARAEGLRASSVRRATAGLPVEVSALDRRLPADARGFAASLFDALHALDDAGCDVLFVERPPADDAWAGVRDRLLRASR